MDNGELVLVAGSTGYVGRRLVPELIEAGYHVRCLARNTSKLSDETWRADVEVVPGDVLDGDSLLHAMEGVDYAFYLVHSIGASGDWEERDRQAAATFADAASHVGVKQIVYLGGLGDETAGGLSPHLRSRHEVGVALRSGQTPVTELRAAVVIGSGSVSFEMLRHLVEKLPVMVTPSWVNSKCQPIAVRDVLFYLVSVLGLENTYNKVLEVGGADVVTYREMMVGFAAEAGLRRRLIITVPVLSPSLSSRWIGLVTPLPTYVARPLVDSLVNDVVVVDHTMEQLVPHHPIGYREAVRLALRRVADLDVQTTWTDAELRGRTPADPMPTDPQWSGGTVYEDVQRVPCRVDATTLFTVVCGIGGTRGWLVRDWMWSVRGVIDRVLGGIGMRRGRRHPDQLRTGDVVDCWRVEEIESPSLLRLRAEMRVPGAAWLEWNITPADGGGAVLTQRARFAPKGLAGRLYWGAVYPFHKMVFAPLANALVARAEAT